MFTVAHGMFKLGNAATGNALEGGLAGKMFTAGSFGLVSDASGEAQRQIQQNGSVTNWGSVLEHGVVGSVINAAGGGITGAPSEVADARTTRGGVRAESGAAAFPDLMERVTERRGPDRSELARRVKDARLLEQVGRDEQVPYRWGGSVTRRGDAITSMTDATGQKFVYDYSRHSKEHPQRIIFPDGRTAERVVDKATPVWHEFDAEGNRTQVHNDVYKVLGDGSLMRYNEDDNYRATTWRTDGALAHASGVDEHIAFPSGKQAVVSSPMFLVVRDGASPLFRVAVDRALQAIPRPLREAMQQRGQKIIIGRSLTSVFPQLKGEPLRGWSSKETWDNAEGGTFGDDVVLGEFKKNSAGRDIPTERAPGVLRHEASHGLNAALGENGRNFSESPEFLTAHNADVTDMPETVRRKLAYLLQFDGGMPSRGGRDEAFAELAAINLGGGSAPWLQSDILHYFPRTNQLVTRRLSAEIAARTQGN